MPAHWRRAADSSFLCRAGLSRLTGPRALRTECEDTATPRTGCEDSRPQASIHRGPAQRPPWTTICGSGFSPLAPVQSVHRCGQWSALGVCSKLPVPAAPQKCQDCSLELPGEGLSFPKLPEGLGGHSWDAGLNLSPLTSSCFAQTPWPSHSLRGTLPWDTGQHCSARRTRGIPTHTAPTSLQELSAVGPCHFPNVPDGRVLPTSRLLRQPQTPGAIVFSLG